jgi:hypothetical protein
MSDYQEAILTTSNTKLAAVLMVLNAKLRHKLPLEWNDTWESKEAYLNGYKPKESVSFNFDPISEDLRDAINSFNDEEAEEKFITCVKELCTGNEQIVKEIINTHIRAVVRLCREVLDNREFLVRMIKSFPNESKWDVIKGSEEVQFVKIGKNSSTALRTEFLNKL